MACLVDSIALYGPSHGALPPLSPPPTPAEPGNTQTVELLDTTQSLETQVFRSKSRFRLNLRILSLCGSAGRAGVAGDRGKLGRAWPGQVSVWGGQGCRASRRARCGRSGGRSQHPIHPQSGPVTSQKSLAKIFSVENHGSA